MKKILRKQLLNRRKIHYLEISSNHIINIFELIKKKYKNIKVIGGYVPINYEIDSLIILKQLEKSGHKISLPITRKGSKMDFFEWSSKEPLLIGKIGIPEPLPKKKVYPDILLVPLVAFNKYKFRLGYGGGYYDRYIQKMKKIKKIFTIGLAFSFQEVSNLPITEYDKKLDFIFTEDCIK